MRLKTPFLLAASLLLCLCLPSRLLAYPADSLLLVHIMGTYASGETDTAGKYEYFRDDRGFWHERKYAYFHDSLTSVNENTYGANRLLVATSTSYRDAQGRANLVTSNLEYDSQGRYSKVVYHYGETVSITYDFSYDTSGKLQKQNVIYSPPHAPAYYLCEYDVSGRLLFKRLFEADTLAKTQAYAYDAEGNVIRDAHLDSKGDTSSYTTMEYDGAGRITREVIVFENRTIIPMDIRTGYDAMGNVDTVKYYEDLPRSRWFEVFTYRSVNVPVPVRGFLPGRKPANPDWRESRTLRDALGRPFGAGRLPGARFPSDPGAARAGSPMDR